MAEETAANDKKIYRFTVNLNPVRYARRFGIEIPDDSADIGLTGDADKSESSSDERKRGSESAAEKTDNKQSGGEGRAQDGADGLFEVDAEDATVDYGKRMAGTMAGQCAATLAQCKAKNPMTCRFHGAKVIAQDIENFLRQQGVHGQVTVELQNVTKQGRKELLSAQVEIVGTKKEAKLVTKAMQTFANLPGVDSVEDGDYAPGKRIYTGFDIDILDPQAQARWGAAQAAQAPTPTPQPAPAPQPSASGQQQAAQPTPQPQPAPQPQQTPQATHQPPHQPAQPPAPQAPATPSPAIPSSATQPMPVVLPTANGPKLHPPVRPEEPPQFNGINEDDGEFLEGVGLDLAFLAQRVNHNLSKNPPVPGAGSMAAQKFAAIDGKKIDALAKKDTSGQAAVIKSIFDAAKASEKNGWTDKIEAPGIAYDESKYNSADPTASTGYAKWKFDMSKCPKDPHAKARKAWKDWVEPSKARSSDVSTANDILTSAEADAPKKEAQQLIDADRNMKDIEDTILELDDALKQEKDPDYKKAIQNTIEHVEVAYAAKYKEYEDARKTIADYIGNQVAMSPGASCTDIANKLAAQGKYVPPLLLTADAKLKSHEKAAHAARAADIAAAGGQAKAETNFANNIKAMWESDEVEVLINTNIDAVISLLQPKGKYESIHGLDSDYVNLGNWNFGTTYKNVQEQHKYCAFFKKGSAGIVGYGNCCIVLNKKKAVGFIGGRHSRTRCTGKNGNIAVMPNNPKLTGYWGGDLVRKDMSKNKNAGADVLDAFHGSPEFWYAGDLTRDVVGLLRVDPGDVAELKRDKEACAFIKRTGLAVEVNGKIVPF